MKPLCQVRSPERRGADDVAQISRHAGAQAPARHGLLGMCMCACVCEWERGGGGRTAHGDAAHIQAPLVHASVI